MEFPAAGHDDRAAAVRPPHVHLLDLRRHLHRRVRRDVLLAVQAPEVGGARGASVPREHDGRDHLDGDPVPHPAVHGVPGDQDDPRDEGHVRARPHREGHGLPVEVELRLSAGRDRLLLDARDADGADPRPGAERRALPARGRPSAGRAGRHQGAGADHRRRRAARVVGARLRRQAGRDSRVRARLVVPCGAGRHLPRPVRRALRQGARLHADRRRGEVEGRLRDVGRRHEEEDRRGRRRPGQGLGRQGPGRAGREGLCRQLCRLPPGDRQGRAARVPAARRLEGGDRPESRADQDGVERRRARRQADGDAVVEAAVGHRYRGRHHLHAQQLGQPHRAKRCSPPKSRSRASSRRAGTSGDTR